VPGWLAGALILTVTGLLSACGTNPPTAGSPPTLSGNITVFAAASLNAAYTAVGKEFENSHPGTKVTFTFGGSSTLVSQIQQGATGDVLASADQPNMQKLIKAGLTAESPIVFARNNLEIVVGKGNPKHITSLADLARSELVVVLCTPVVPCGHYAAQALQKAGVSVMPASQEADVKAVLSKVALGEADAGIVYVTDVKAAGAGVEGVAIPPALNVVAEYPIVILKDSRNRALARAFVSYVLTEGRPVLARYGFTSP
jgi:molybdate transport system substrate-binding protein